MINLPIFRGLKLGTKNEYVEGFLKNCTDTGLDIFWIQDKDFIDYRVDIDTLSINFPNMIDRYGNKIFASLQENGIGEYILFNKEFVDTIKEVEYLQNRKCENCKHYSTGKQPDGFEWHKCDYAFECKTCFNDYFEREEQ